MQEKMIAVYARVSSSSQSTRSQKPDLLRWIKAQGKDANIKKFIDKCSGKTMNRPKWNRIEQLIRANKVSQLVIWRLDRLGRTAAGLTKLFEELQKHKCNLISLKDNLDLSTSSGRLMAHILASVAVYENEVRTERVAAGQAVARAAGKTWGGSKKGALHKHTKEQVKQIVKMHRAGEKVGVISKTVGTHRQNVYRILRRVREGDIKV